MALRVYIGTYTSGDDEGIFYGDVDINTGAITIRGNAGGITSPSYLCLDSKGENLYAVSEVSDFEGSGALQSYSVDAASGSLTEMNRQPTGGPGGAGPCHNTVEANDRYVLTANYGGGSCCIHPIQSDGSLGELTDFKQHEGSSVVESRQQGPHGHSINMDPGNHFAFCADLGLDKVLIYELDFETGKLNEHGAATVTPGAGPRHFAFHPNRKFGYVINEIGNTITAYRYNETAGSLTQMQEISTIPDDFDGTTHTADIHLTPNGRYLYGSNRGHDSIAAYSVDGKSGQLSLIQFESVPSTPRNFAIDPSGTWLLSGGQNTDEIASFRIENDGTLNRTEHVTQVPKPVCLKFVTLS
ncbi:MAG: lactonase family protein [Candidatus Latescibacterota bacterium]|nr:lactonase family protein [Candidatus Latescibacterota bacterium]